MSSIPIINFQMFAGQSEHATYCKFGQTLRVFWTVTWLSHAYILTMMETNELFP